MYTFLKRSRLHEPMVLIVKQINDLAADPTSVPHAQSAGLQTGRPANIQNAVYGKDPPVLPYDGRRPDAAIDVEFCMDFQIDLHESRLLTICLIVPYCF